MKAVFKPALTATLPVMAGYLVLGIGFGILMNAGGYSLLLSFVMSLMIYAGSMQYVAIGLFSGGASLLTVGLTTLMVNARHLFYGISMLTRYRSVGKKKPYLIFALTDETYSLVCGDIPHIPEEHRADYCFAVSLLDHLYWVTGSVIGAVIGDFLPFSTDGIDFALTALFLTVFCDQWLSTDIHLPAIIGVVASVGCLLFFGSDNFLIPAMVLIAVTLVLYPEQEVGAHD